MAPPSSHGAGAVSNLTSTGYGVLEHLPSDTLLLSAPKPHVGQERNLKRAGFARNGAKSLMHQHRAEVKSQAKSVLQNLPRSPDSSVASYRLLAGSEIRQPSPKALHPKVKY